MGSLHKILSVGGESLMNSRAAIDVTGHNIANVNTEGYSKQNAQVETKVPYRVGDKVFGAGARLSGIHRAHDAFLEKQIVREEGNFGLRNKVSEGLERLENFFNPELSSTIRDNFNNFFNSVRELSSFPDEPSVRTNLVESARALTHAFQKTHASVREVQQDSSKQSFGVVKDISDKLREIADLNQKIREIEAGAQSPVNDFHDRRDFLVREVAEEVGAEYYLDGNSQMVVRGPGDTLLVDGNLAAQLRLEYQESTAAEPNIIMVSTDGVTLRDVTKVLNKGELGGLIQVRDKHAGGILEQLDTLARDFATEFNRVHRMGYGLGEYAEKQGRDFFEGLNLPGNAAENLEVGVLVANDIDAISASMTPDAPGDNIIANELLRVSYNPVVTNGTERIGEAYDRFVGQLGFDSREAQENRKASEIVRSQLQTQKQSVSGVSLDEEASNLLKYQHTFNASSKIITTADELFETIIGLKR